MHRTRIRKEIQAERVFKYYGLPKEKVVELGGSLGKSDYYERDNQGERQSCGDRGETQEEKNTMGKQVGNGRSPHKKEQKRSKDDVLQR